MTVETLTPVSPTAISRILGLLEEHLELLALELRYEADRGEKRLFVSISAAGCMMLALACLQVAVIALLVRVGAPLYVICGAFAVVWGLAGTLIYFYAGKRDTGAGEPFEGSRSEIRKTIQWIRQHTS